MGRIVDDHPSGLTYEEQDEKEGSVELLERPAWASIANGMTDEELNREEERVITELEAKNEEDLTIYNEEDLTKEEAIDLPEGALMRDRENGMIYLKVLDIWMPYSMRTPTPPERGLTKYGRMRKKYLEEWKAQTVLELGEDFLVHCLEVQDRAQEMKRELMDQWREQNPSNGTMEWVQRAEMQDAEVERLVLDTVIWPEAAKSVISPL